MDYNELERLCTEYMRDKHIRRGQAYMNALYKVNPDLHDKILGTEADCFYVDEKIPEFIRVVYKEE